MRTTWNGTIAFGLVNIPVGLAPATKARAAQSDISFRMLHRECGSPIKQKRWCPVHERELQPEEIVKGWEHAKGEFVLVEEADLEALEARDTSRTLEISEFVPLDQIDPVFFDRTYLLVPAQPLAARRPYVLLLETLKAEQVGGIGRFVLAGKEKLFLIRAKGDALALETLFLVEDVASQAEIDEAVALTEVKETELELAQAVVASMQTDFDPQALTSSYRSSLHELLKAKLAGAELVVPEQTETPAVVIDLMEALRASVAEAKGKQKSPAEKKPRKTAARAR